MNIYGQIVCQTFFLMKRTFQLFAIMIQMQFLIDNILRIAMARKNKPLVESILIFHLAKILLKQFFKNRQPIKQKQNFKMNVIRNYPETIYNMNDYNYIYLEKAIMLINTIMIRNQDAKLK